MKKEGRKIGGISNNGQFSFAPRLFPSDPYHYPLPVFGKLGVGGRRTPLFYPLYLSEFSRNFTPFRIPPSRDFAPLFTPTLPHFFARDSKGKKMHFLPLRRRFCFEFLYVEKLKIRLDPPPYTTCNFSIFLVFF